MTPLVIAHRGAWDAPENTIEAFELAIAQGADYVEFDVRTAEDGRLVVTHDPLRGPLPTGVPTLDEVLETCRGRVGLTVEIKEAAAAEATCAALVAHNCSPDQTMVVSFRIRALQTVRRRLPGLRCALHVGRRPDPLAATRFWGAGFEDARARPRQLHLAQSHGLATLVFTVNEPARMRELADLGVTGIFTDRPALLRSTLESRSG